MRMSLERQDSAEKHGHVSGMSCHRYDSVGEMRMSLERQDSAEKHGHVSGMSGRMKPLMGHVTYEICHTHETCHT